MPINILYVSMKRSVSITLWIIYLTLSHWQYPHCLNTDIHIVLILIFTCLKCDILFFSIIFSYYFCKIYVCLNSNILMSQLKSLQVALPISTLSHLQFIHCLITNTHRLITHIHIVSLQISTLSHYHYPHLITYIHIVSLPISTSCHSQYPHCLIDNIHID